MDLTTAMTEREKDRKIEKRHRCLDAKEKMKKETGATWYIKTAGWNRG